MVRVSRRVCLFHFSIIHIRVLVTWLSMNMPIVDQNTTFLSLSINQQKHVHVNVPANTCYSYKVTCTLSVYSRTVVRLKTTTNAVTLWNPLDHLRQFARSSWIDQITLLIHSGLPTLEHHGPRSFHKLAPQHTRRRTPSLHKTRSSTKTNRFPSDNFKHF